MEDDGNGAGVDLGGVMNGKEDRSDIPTAMLH
jgi:hypothetical protein